MKKFSKSFSTFFDWKNQASNTTYAKQIERLHYKYPNATLPQLSGRRKLPSKKLPVYLVDTRGLKSKDRLLRIHSLSVLNRIRKGENSKMVIDEVGLVRSVLTKHLGSSIRFTKNTTRVTKYDKIPREMIISSNGIETSIIVTNSKDASIIGKYQNAKRHYLQTSDNSKLKKFSRIKIKDIDGKIHKLETNTNRIIEIEEKKEESESFEIYKS